MRTAFGPFRLMDKVGLDIVLDIENRYVDENPDLPRSPGEMLEKLVNAGHLGVSTEKVFYDDYATSRH